jgi:hypothetical protein
MVHLLSLKEAGPNLLKISESAFAPRLPPDRKVGLRGTKGGTRVRRHLKSQKDTPPGSKYDVRAAFCIKLGLQFPASYV